MGADILKPGIYEDVPFDEYLAIDAISNTGMGAMAKSPRHFRYAEPLGKLKPLVLGNMVHTARLEPKAFAERYSVCPRFQDDEENCTGKGERSQSKATSYVKSRTAEFIAAEEKAGREVVSAEWFAEMVAVVAALSDDARANATFNTFGPFELTIIWQDDDTGLRCKARMDKVCTHQGKFCDLKTTADILKFPKSFGDFNYHRQMAHYQAGYAAVTGEILEPWIVAIEKCSPHCVHTARVDEEAIACGFAEQQRLLQLICECRESDDWPGPPAPDVWRLPEWKMTSEPVELVVNGQKVSL